MGITCIARLSTSHYININDPEYPYLIDAISCRNISIVEFLLKQKNIDINMKFPKRSNLTALKKSLIVGDYDIIKCLLDHPNIDI